MAIIRSAIHMLWMLVTVIPIAFWMVGTAPFSNASRMYAAAKAFLYCAIYGLRAICGVLECPLPPVLPDASRGSES